MSLSDIYGIFISPGNDLRGKPFWSWNGSLDKDELIRQVYVCKEMGFGGFFMHSRVGLATEYLGDLWFECINACADLAEELGMDAYLYDEDRWPSGTCGGIVTMKPEYRQKFMRLRITETAEVNWDDEHTLACYVGEVDELKLGKYSRVAAGQQPAPAAGQKVMVASWEDQNFSYFYNGYTYVDTLNREATDYYIELTHDRYVEMCGDRIGKSIKAIFTDEPHRGPLMETFSLSNESPEWLVPWTAKAFDEFNTRFGYDLLDCLPELYLQLNGELVSRVKWNYVDLLQMLFLENWAQPYHDWCEEHNIMMTGHILHEDCLASQVAVSGSMMRFYEHMHWPGIDLLTEHNRNYWVAKQLQSATRQIGQKWLLSELYGCTGWQMDLNSHKNVGDWQALYGINMRCPHLSWYTMYGEAKRDYPASIFHQSAWYKDYDQMETYFSRFGLMMMTGKPVCDLLVVNPVESVYSLVHPKWSWGLGPVDPVAQKLDKQYAELFHWLSGSQIDFDYGEEEIMNRLASVSMVDGEAVLKVGQASYKSVLVSGVLTLRASTVKLLNEFKKLGGKVIFAGDVPVYVNAVKSADATALAANCSVVSFDKSSVVGAVTASVPPVVTVTTASGEATTDIFTQVREDDGNLIVMLLNVDRAKTIDATIKIESNLVPQTWNLLNGERTATTYQRDGEWITIQASFVPGGELLYVLSQQDGSLQPEAQLAVVSETPIDGEFDYQLTEANTLVLDYARYKIAEGEWQSEKEVLKIDRTVRDQYGITYRGGEMPQPWFITKHIGVKEYAVVQMEFDFEVSELPQGESYLLIEDPSDWNPSLNGVKLDVPADGQWEIDICFKKIVLPQGALRLGRNVLHLQGMYTDLSNIEAIYLRGCFGVKLNGTVRTMVKAPAKLAIGDIVAQNLPFYAAGVNYKYQLPAVGCCERLFIKFNSFEGACVAVSSGDKRVVASWVPYELDVTDMAGSVVNIEVVLTRRNMFGPLHQSSLFNSGYGPDNFTTGGAGWNDNYMLYPAGLLEAPVLQVRE